MAEAIQERRKLATPDEPGLEPPDSTEGVDAEVAIKEDLFRSLLESADYADDRSALPARSSGALELATPESIRKAFVDAWDGLSHSLHLGIEPEDALAGLRDLVVYDIPDGTRSTLSVPNGYDVESDAGMYCLAMVHTLASLGAQHAVLLTHTTYNRERGPEDTARFLKIIAHGIEPFRGYARRHRVGMHLYGLHAGYELEPHLVKAFPVPEDPTFHAHFLLDYQEEWFLTPEYRAYLDALPEIDVVVRHTKLQVSGGWIPTRMRKAAYMYSQNGSLHSNWTFPEYAALIAVAYLAKVLQKGEALSKQYVSVDEIKERYKKREVDLLQRTVRLSAKPKKLFVVGSSTGLIQVYA